jgi:hypothetical protein
LARRIHSNLHWNGNNNVSIRCATNTFWVAGLAGIEPENIDYDIRKIVNDAKKTQKYLWEQVCRECGIEKEK